MAVQISLGFVQYFLPEKEDKIYKAALALLKSIEDSGELRAALGTNIDLKDEKAVITCNGKSEEISMYFNNKFIYYEHYIMENRSAALCTSHM